MPCSLCGEERHDYQFLRFGLAFEKCPACGLIYTEKVGDRPSTFTVDNEQAISPDNIPLDQPSSTTEEVALRTYFSFLKERGLCCDGPMLLLSENVEILPDANDDTLPPIEKVQSLTALERLPKKQQFSAALIIYQLEKHAHPQEMLAEVHKRIKPDGLLALVTLSLDSSAAKLLGGAWIGWRPENKVYFSEKTIQLLLWKAGFEQLRLHLDERKYTIAHLNQRAGTFPHTWVTRIVRSVYKIFPNSLRKWSISLPSSGMIVIGRKAQQSQGRKCSFIVPVFNEVETFGTLIEALISKQLPMGLKKEIIIIESNSQDGTREAVLELKDHPQIKVILQEKASGKGNAVREGFRHASGDMVIIQDGDLEYDLNDIDDLLMPLIRYQAPFVLGSRHGGQWKMRQFADEKGISNFLNFGHLLFTGLLNLLYGQKLKDPFTMYKVFQRDCLYGLRFESNRFDFDFELVIKLIRKGYVPIEIPVNYRSRSFKEGKKVRILRDPLTWLWALVKFRFTRIYDE